MTKKEKEEIIRILNILAKYEAQILKTNVFNPIYLLESGIERLNKLLS